MEGSEDSELVALTPGALEPSALVAQTFSQTFPINRLLPTCSGLFFLALASLALISGPSGRSVGVHSLKFLGADAELSTIDAPSVQADCSAHSEIDATDVLHNNLGGKGPDTGQEGIGYQVLYKHNGKSTLAELWINVKDGESYESHAPEQNGLSGDFFAINLAPGSATWFTMTLRRFSDSKPFPIKHGFLSFFDLDTALDGSAVESITVKHFAKKFLTHDNSIMKYSEGDFTTFTASKPGTVRNNPKEPNELTDNQRNMAVTLEFDDAAHWDFQLAATSSHVDSRVFTLAGFPAVECAKKFQSDQSTLAVPKPADFLFPGDVTLKFGLSQI